MADDDATQKLTFDASGAKQGAFDFVTAGNQVIATNQAVVAAETKAADAINAAATRSTSARRGAAQAARDATTIQVAAGTAGGDAVTAQTDRIVTSTSKQTAAINRVAASFDPMLAAATRAQRQLETVMDIGAQGGPQAARANALAPEAVNRLNTAQANLSFGGNVGSVTDQLTAKFAPAQASAKAMTAELAELNQALELGIGIEGGYAAAWDNIVAKYDLGVQAAKRANDVQEILNAQAKAAQGVLNSQAQVNQFAGVKTSPGSVGGVAVSPYKSAADSAAVFQAQFDTEEKLAAENARLAATYDPLSVASAAYAASLADIDTAASRNIITTSQVADAQVAAANKLRAAQLATSVGSANLALGAAAGGTPLSAGPAAAGLTEAGLSVDRLNEQMAELRATLTDGVSNVGQYAGAWDRVSGSMDAYVAAATRANAITVEEIVQARMAQNAVNSQAAVNQFAGVQTSPGSVGGAPVSPVKSAQDSFAAFDQAGMTADLDAQRKSVDSLYLVSSQYADKYATIQNLKKQGVYSDDQEDVAINELNVGYQKQIDNMNAAGKSANGLSLANSGVTRELIVMGHEALMGNYTRLGGSMIVIAERVGGLGEILKSVGAFMVSPAGIATTLGVVAVGAVTAFAVAAEIAAQRVEKLQNALALVRPDFASATQDALQAAKTLSATSFLAAPDARTGTQTVYSNPAFQGTQKQAEQITLAFATLSQSLGETAVDWKRLGDAMNNPAAVLQTLLDQNHLIGVNQALVDHAKLMQDAGDKAGAFGIALHAIQNATAGTVIRLTDLQAAEKRLNEAFSGDNSPAAKGFGDSFGSAIDKNVAQFINGVAIIIEEATRLGNWLDRNGWGIGPTNIPRAAVPAEQQNPTAPDLAGVGYVPGAIPQSKTGSGAADAASAGALSRISSGFAGVVDTMKANDKAFWDGVSATAADASRSTWQQIGDGFKLEITAPLALLVNKMLGLVPGGAGASGVAISAGGASGPVSTNYDVNVATDVVAGLVARGVPNLDAIALAAMNIAETGGNFTGPGAVGDPTVQAGVDPTYGAYPGGSHGGFQWNKGRLANFMSQNQGQLPEQTSMDTQLNFVVSELSNAYKGMYAAAQSAPDLATKTAIYTGRYEVPADVQGQIPARVAIATDLQAKLAAGATTGAAPVQSAVPGSPNSLGGAASDAASAGTYGGYSSAGGTGMANVGIADNAQKTADAMGLMSSAVAEAQKKVDALEAALATDPGNAYWAEGLRKAELELYNVKAAVGAATTSIDAQTAVAVRSADIQTAGEKRMADAWGQGATAAAEMTNQIKAETQATQFAKPGSDQWKADVAAITPALNAQAAATQGVAQAQQALTDNNTIAYTQKEIDTLGMEAGARTAVLSALKAQQDAEIKYAQNPAAQQAEEAKQAAISKTTFTLQQNDAALSAVASGFSESFDTIGNAMTQSFLSGQGAAVNWANVMSSAAQQVLQQFMKLAVINPLLNSLGFGGTNGLPTLETVGNAINNQAVQGIGLGGMLSGTVLGNLFGVTGTDPSLSSGSLSANDLAFASGSAAADVSQIPLPPIPVAHAGWQVGAAAPALRSIHPAYFDDAPRFHSGMTPTLAADEFPAILQRGERVITAKQDSRVLDVMGKLATQAQAASGAPVVPPPGGQRDVFLPMLAHAETVANALPRGAASAAVFHAGGVVGQPATSATVLLANFIGAPRFHDGGLGDPIAAAIGSISSGGASPASGGGGIALASGGTSFGGGGGASGGAGPFASIARMAGTDPLAAAVTSIFSGSAALSPSSFLDGFFGRSTTTSHVFHNGGIVGQPIVTGPVWSADFAHAPRLHGGGLSDPIAAAIATIPSGSGSSSNPIVVGSGGSSFGATSGGSWASAPFASLQGMAGTDPLAAAIMSIFSMAGGAASPPSASSFLDGFFDKKTTHSAIFHNGGVVGAPAASALFPVGLFARAPRFHDGTTDADTQFTGTPGVPSAADRIKALMGPDVVALPSGGFAVPGAPGAYPGDSRSGSGGAILSTLGPLALPLAMLAMKSGSLFSGSGLLSANTLNTAFGTHFGVGTAPTVDNPWAIPPGYAADGFTPLPGAVAGVVPGAVAAGTDAASAVADAAGAASDASSIFDATASLFAFHQGGLVGQARAPTRSMPLVDFAILPRFHDGLGADEFLTMLDPAHRVLTAAHQSSLMQSASAMGVGPGLAAILQGGPAATGAGGFPAILQHGEKTLGVDQQAAILALMGQGKASGGIRLDSLTMPSAAGYADPIPRFHEGYGGQDLLDVVSNGDRVMADRQQGAADAAAAASNKVTNNEGHTINVTLQGVGGNGTPDTFRRAGNQIARAVLTGLSRAASRDS